MGAGKVSRNDACPCGSGRKYKQCCAGKREQMSRVSQIAVIGVIVAIVAVVAYAFTADRGSGSRQVWDPVHGHFHNVP